MISRIHNGIMIYLVGGIPTPLKNMTSSVGMIVPNIWKHKIHVPNHQPEDSLKSFSFLGDQWFLRCPNFEKRPFKYCLHTFTRTIFRQKLITALGPLGRPRIQSNDLLGALQVTIKLALQPRRRKGIWVL